MTPVPFGQTKFDPQGGSRRLRPLPASPRLQPGELVAALFRCPACSAWWGSGSRSDTETRLLCRLVEPHSSRYLWADFRGWRRNNRDKICSACGEVVETPELVLRADAQGRIIWPAALQGQEDGRVPESADSAANPFIRYVTASEKMTENLAVIARRQAEDDEMAPAYTADINDVRDNISEMKKVFKRVVYGYASLLPPGWHVTGDYDKWLRGQACAGFVHGALQPDASLLIGGDCSTVAELEMQLDRLYTFVCALRD